MAMAEMDEVRLSIRELATRTSTSIRTIRYYLAAGILPSSGARGKAASYGEEHELRLRLVRRLVEQRVPLADIKERLVGLSLDELRALLAEEEVHKSRLEQAAQAASPREYVATLMERGRTTLPAASLRRRAILQESTGAVFPQRREPLPPPPDPPRHEGWFRWQLAPGVELHVNQATHTRYRQLIDQLLRVARAVQSETDR